MKVQTEVTRHGRQLIRAQTTDGRILRLSLAPKAVDTYSALYGQQWPRRVVKDYLKLGALAPNVEMQCFDQGGGAESPLIVREDRRSEDPAPTR